MSDAFTWAIGLAYKPLRTERDVSRTGYSQRLELRQTQALVMTPQLQQAIKMLQLSNLQLADYVDAELEQTPLLERGEAEGEVGGSSGEAGGVEIAATEAAAPPATTADFPDD